MLSFVVQPTRTGAGDVIDPAPQVAILDSSGHTDTAAVWLVRIALAGHPLGSTLTGTTQVNAIAGVATFSDLRLDRPDTVTLVALADGATRATSIKFRVFPPYVTLTAGAEHSCATAATGAAFCWGNAGTLGNGRSDFSWGFPQDVVMPQGVRFDAVAAGGYHTCALTTIGALYCWGANLFNQLGNGTTDPAYVPVPVTMPVAAFVSLSTGYWHSCALTASGVAYCWGGNGDGQLGDGTTTSRSTPVAVMAPSGVAFASLSAGGAHTCALATTGTAYCWGENPAGGLGDGTTAPHSSPMPVSMPSGVAFKAVSAGDEHSCGLATDGAVYCWGRNDGGALGDGTTTAHLTPVLAATPPGVTFRSIDAGRLRTCGVTTSGSVYCWGMNGLQGILGDGTTIDRTSPTLMPTPQGVGFASVDVGAGHTCALTASKGIAYCWGDNGSGQRGGGSYDDKTPVRVDQ
jgi:alpha-tubulin suppressor-like RCC1 family protein